MNEQEKFKEQVHKVDTLVTQLQEFSTKTLELLGEIDNNLQEFRSGYTSAKSYWMARVDIDCG
ncbi:MAG: hypothetical protein WBP82_09910, partial [Leuconostoc mesenteroides]